MKTKRLLASLFGAAAMLAFAVGCNEDKPVDPVEPGKGDTDTVAVWGISKLTVNAEGGAQEVEFEPTGDWTFVSETDWLVVDTKAGVKTDRLIKFTAAPNTTFDARVATTKITIGGITKTLNISQKAAMRSIKVYSSLITFEPGMTEVVIPNIYANVEFEVSSMPDWVESVDIQKLEDSYEALVTLKAANYDDASRSGDIVFKDKASDFSTAFVLACDATKANYMVTTNGAFDFPFEEMDVEKLKANFTISQKPGAEDYRVVAYVKPDFGRYNTIAAWVTLTEKTVAAAAYTNREFEAAMPLFYDQFGGSTHTASVFIVPMSVGNTGDENADANAITTYVNEPGTKAAFEITQNKYMSIKTSYNAETDPIVFIAASGAKTKQVDVKVRTGLTFKVELESEHGAFDASRGENAVKFTQVGDKVTTAGWDTYTYDIVFPAAFDMGTRTQMTGNLIDVYIPATPDADFNWSTDEYVEFSFDIYDVEQ